MGGGSSSEGKEPELHPQHHRVRAKAQALRKAVESGDAEKMRELLGKGNSANLTDSDGSTALHHVAAEGHSTCIAELLAHGAEVGAMDKSGQTALHWATGRGHKECIRELLAGHADPNVQASDGSTALHRAADGGHADCVCELLACGARVQTEDRGKASALHSAAMKGHASCVAELLTCDADVGATDSYGETALHRAAARGHPDCIRSLIVGGADVHAAAHLDILKHTALQLAATFAARHGRADALHALILHGADVEAELARVQAGGEEDVGSEDLTPAEQDTIDAVPSALTEAELGDARDRREKVCKVLRQALDTMSVVTLRAYVGASQGGLDVDCMNAAGKTLANLQFEGNGKLASSLLLRAALAERLNLPEWSLRFRAVDGRPLEEVVGGLVLEEVLKPIGPRRPMTFSIADEPKTDDEGSEAEGPAMY